MRQTNFSSPMSFKVFSRYLYGTVLEKEDLKCAEVSHLTFPSVPSLLPL